MGQRTLASAFAAWSDHSLQMQSAKQAMQQVAARLTNRQLSAAFYAWHEAALQKQHAVQSAHKVLLKLQQGCKVTLPAHAAILNAALYILTEDFHGQYGQCVKRGLNLVSINQSMTVPSACVAHAKTFSMIV